VVFSVEQWKAGPVNGGFFANVASASATGERTVEVKLSKADTYIEPLLSWCVSAVYPKDWGGVTQEQFAQHPIGAGPYMLAEWKNPGPSEEIVLQRNPHYWDAGKPKLDEITFRSNADPNQRVLAYKGGDVDLLEQLEFEVANQIPSDELVYGPNMRIELLLVNTKKAPLDDPAVRQAIAAAIDRDALTQLYDGHAVVADGILPNNVPFGGKPTTGFTFDLDRAKSLMSGSSIPDGAPLELLADAGRAPEAQVIADQLSRIGLDITVTIVDNGTLFARAADGDYDLEINGNVATSPSAMDPIVATQVIDWYFTGMPATTAADDIAAALASDDDGERSALVTKIQDALVEEAGMIGLVTLDSVYAVKPSIHGFAPFPFLRWYPQDMTVSG
jgi:ABC-type transport system substrate-binding protein